MALAVFFLNKFLLIWLKSQRQMVYDKFGPLAAGKLVAL